MGHSNKALLLTVTFSCLLLSATAVPTSRLFNIAPVNAPTAAPSAAPTAAPTAASTIDSTLDLFGSVLNKAINQFSPELNNFCTGTENPALCAETIKPFMSGTFDPVEALETEIKATLEKAKQIAAVIAEKLNDPATAKKALDALGICKSEYKDMLEDIQEALDMVQQQNVVDAYYKFSSVISEKSTCDDAFGESPGVEVPFADHDSTALFQLGGNVLAIMEGIVKNNKF